MGDLILDNLALIYLIINKMGLQEKKDYYYDIGLFGLIKAAINYDESKGYKFTALASMCIKNEILMDMRKNSRRPISVSLDEPLTCDDDITLMDVLPCENSVEDDVIENVEVEKLRIAISMLKQKEQDVLKEYYFSDKKVTMAQMAKERNITQASISKRLIRIVNKLKRIMNNI